MKALGLRMMRENHTLVVPKCFVFFVWYLFFDEFFA